MMPEQKIEALERRVFDLENLVEAYLWCYQSHEIDRPTLSVAIRLAVGDYFGVSQHEITGAAQIGTGKGRRFQIRSRSLSDIKLLTVREWIVLLMRQCLQTEHPALQRVYPWCFQTTYRDAGKKLEALYANPQETDHQVWRELLNLVREKGKQLKLDTTWVDQQINLIE